MKRLTEYQIPCRGGYPIIVRNHSDSYPQQCVLQVEGKGLEYDAACELVSALQEILKEIRDRESD